MSEYESWQNLAPSYTPEPDYFAFDYIRLPGYGDRYYSLPDAALLGALDIWGSNMIPDFPLGDHGFREDGPDVRKGIARMQEAILTGLIRLVETQHLEATVFGRELSTSRLLPHRTYVHLSELVECLEQFGFTRGDLIAGLELEGDVDPWTEANSIARARAEFRLGVHFADPRSEPGGSLQDDLPMLQREVQAKQLHIAHLERQLGGRKHTFENDNRPMTTRERNLFLAIGALLEQVGGKQEAIIGDITMRHLHVRGLSRRTLESVFAEARRSLKPDPL